MPEIIVQYKNKKTLEALRDFAKYFDYKIVMPNTAEETEKRTDLHGVTILSADASIDTSELTDIFTGKNINPLGLRTKAWERKK